MRMRLQRQWERMKKWRKEEKEEKGRERERERTRWKPSSVVLFYNYFIIPWDKEEREGCKEVGKSKNKFH
jgi:hypothetical protein